jgi:hypothetical protein
MGEVPESAESLFSVPAADFVDDRKRLARKLRDEGRKDEAAVVAALRKPPPVVLAANRAVRSRPEAAKAAARAASKLTKQLGNADAREELDGQLALLEEVALAFLVGEGSVPSEATRRRVHDLLRNAMADEDARAALARGGLTYEPEAAGFAAYTAIPSSPSTPASTAPKERSASRRTEASEAKRRAREQVLRDEIDAARERLDAAREAEVTAARERARAEKALTAAQDRLDRLSRR